MATTRQSRLDDLVQSVTLYNPRSLLWHSYVLPFVVLQAAWIYGWVFVYGVSEHYEAGLVGIAAIAVVQIFTCLSCQWSVHVHTFFNYSPVSTFPFLLSISHLQTFVYILHRCAFLCQFLFSKPNETWQSFLLNTLCHVTKPAKFKFWKFSFCWFIWKIIFWLIKWLFFVILGKWSH